MQNPVIVVPGITASELRDEYPVKPDVVWSAVINKDYDRISLHPDDLRYEWREPARVQPNAVFSAAYEDLIDELRHNLTRQADEPVPVYPFPYDWRLPLEITVQQFADFVQEVTDRTKLLRHYEQSGTGEPPYSADPRVDLVGHSMGGLIIAGYLAAHRNDHLVGKVATLGTPFGGSYESPIKVLTGTASLGTLEPRSREREAARITPALYHLLPQFRIRRDGQEEAAVIDGQGNEVDLFQAGNWQSGVLDTLSEFIRLYAVNPARSQRARRTQATALFQEMLDKAKQYLAPTRHARLLQNAGLSASSWLCIAGVDTETRIRLRLHRGQKRFILSSADRINEWKEDKDRHLTGDGTVPLPGAIPTFLSRENIVCVRPKDLGYWELSDRGLLKASGFHGILGRVNLVQRLVIAHLRGDSGNDSIWARPLPDISETEWESPIPGLTCKP